MDNMVKKCYEAPVLEVFDIGVSVLQSGSGENGNGITPGGVPIVFPNGGEDWYTAYDVV